MAVDIVTLADYPFEEEILEGWTPVELTALLQQDDDYRAPLEPFNVDGGAAAFADLAAAKAVYDRIVALYSDEIKEELEDDSEGNGYIGIFEREGVYIIATGQSLGDSSWVFDVLKIKHHREAHMSAQNFPNPLPMN